VATTYLGVLDRGDPLYDVLALRIYPELRGPVFHVERLSRHRLVYRYREAQTNRAVVGKFFDTRDRDETKVTRIKSEYRNLIRLRYLGLNTHPHSVVKPLCREERIGLALAEEYVGGRDLDHYLRRAAWRGALDALDRVLDRLADFLHRLHSRSAPHDGTRGRITARLDDAGEYFAGLLTKLERQGLLNRETAAAYLGLRDRWLGRSRMQAEAVTVHGDATPTNFLFPTAEDVVAIDLERMKAADRAYDLGMVCGELKHAFLWRTGRHDLSEPFIGSFLRRYAGHDPEPHDAFREITHRIPFYMALTELRIARNTWLDWEYRRRLVREAGACLTWGLRL
jgi:aminoglycoside phosphotransferase (APT) family kinase protein